MAGTAFYVRDKKNKLVRAKFFQYEGKPYVDANTSHARSIPLYDASGKLLPTQNVSGYLIVPDDFNIKNSIRFARMISGVMTSSNVSLNGEVQGGLSQALGMMVGAFGYGPQDLQRNYNGRTRQPSVLGFTDAASFNLGLISAYSGIPLSWANEGGGIFNRVVSRFLHKKRPLDTSGVDGLSKLNETSIKAGYQFSSMLPGSANYLPLHRAAREIGKAQKSVSVAPKISITRVHTGGGRTGLPTVVGVPATLRAPRSGAANGAVERSSVGARLTSSGASFAAVSVTGSTALMLWGLRPYASAMPARPALAWSDYASAPAATKKGVLACAVVASRSRRLVVSAMRGEKAWRSAELALQRRPAIAAAGETTGGLPRAAARIARLSALASVAPVRQRAEAGSLAPASAVKRTFVPTDAKATQAPRFAQRDTDASDDRGFRQKLRKFFDQEARLPPSGATGFDPRLSPAWPGLKLPA